MPLAVGWMNVGTILKRVYTLHPFLTRVMPKDGQPRVVVYNKQRWINIRFTPRRIVRHDTG